jgi:UDP-N-acetylmuramate--alanine ligase
MHVYFSGVGGTGIGPLALIAHKAGYTVSGSDNRHSGYIDYLKQHGIIDIHIGQEREHIASVHQKTPIDWFVYTAALPIEQPNAPELLFCKEHNIRATKRDEFLNFIIKERGLKLLAVAGTHGKTTTTALLIWLFKQLDMPVSYAVGAKLGFGDMGEFDPKSEYFIYEADEFDRNFLAFYPYVSLITGIDWDHPDIYPTQSEYNQAFIAFLKQSERAVLWQADVTKLDLKPTDNHVVLDEQASGIDQQLTLPGHVNRLDAWIVAHAVHDLTKRPLDELLAHLNRFPGLSRRFEQLAPGLYTDYAHTPPKIRGALQLAHEVASDNIVVVYEGLHNTRQHFIKNELRHLFDGVKQLYIVPSYLAREDPTLPVLTPEKLRELLSPESQAHAKAAALDDQLATSMRSHLQAGDTVLAISAGGAGSLDEWLRNTFAAK